MSRGLLLSSCLLAVLATTGIASVHITIAVRLSHHTPLNAISIVSATLESTILLVVCYLGSTHAVASVRRKLGKGVGIAFGLGMLACTLAAAASVATLISLDRVGVEATRGASALTRRSFLIGSSVTLGLSFVSQLTFMIAHFFISRGAGLGTGLCLDAQDEGRDSPVSYIKSVRYSQTSPISAMSLSRGDSTGSGDGYPGFEKAGLRTMSSLRSSFSKEVRSVNSKTRLLSVRGRRRAESMESYSTGGEDVIDLCEISTNDSQPTQTLYLPEPAYLPSRPGFLETIPASPTTVSRSPSPALSDLEPPRMAQRSRSYSPVARTRETSSPTPSIASSEMNIHPLFRTDSPTPPPLATPGTNVMASPNAGQVITHRQSIRDLRRMRSGSLPGAPSPLSRQNSFDDLSLRRAKEDQQSIKEIQEIQEIEEEDEDTSSEDEDMKQRQRQLQEKGLAIPEWVLTAGSRNSLTDYHSRKLKADGDN